MSALEHLEAALGARTTALILEVVRQEVVAPAVGDLRSSWADALAEHEQQIEGEWLPLERAAQVLGCSKPALYSRIARGVIPASKVGRRLYVSREDISNLMERKRRRR